MKIVIINGPNLNLLGVREPEKYGFTRFEDYLAELKEKFSGCEVEFYQSNVEGEIINKLHEVGFLADGIVLNAGGYTHFGGHCGCCGGNRNSCGRGAYHQHLCSRRGTPCVTIV